MTFTMDDIDQVLQVIKDLKDIQDVELHLDVGDVKLSVWKGNITRSSAPCAPAQPAQQLMAVTPPPAPVAGETPAAAAPAEPEAAPPAPEPAQQGELIIPEGLVPVRASFTGVFYRKPSPTEPPFVEVGSEVEEDSTVCLIEVMKCFSSITAGVKGRVEQILVEDSNLVEIGTAMFLIRPA